METLASRTSEHPIVPLPAVPFKPYYESGGITIYHADCRKVLPWLDRFDALITDPPYGVIDEEWDKFKEKDFAALTSFWVLWARENCDKLLAFSSCTRNEIQRACEMFFCNMRRLVWDKGSSSTGDGPFWFAYEDIYLCDNERSIEFVKPKYLQFGKSLKRHREAVGISRSAVDILTRGKKTGICFRWEEGACLPTDEQMEILTRELALDDECLGFLAEARANTEATLSDMRQHASENGARYQDVLRFTVKKTTDHPCEKPVALMRLLVNSIGAETIVDPFMGSGTTLVASKLEGRRCVGIEINEAYCEAAAKRLSQGTLF